MGGKITDKNMMERTEMQNYQGKQSSLEYAFEYCVSMQEITAPVKFNIY